jgi:DNA-directed RNA polymerase specialized sigma24 family protein
VVIVAQCGEGNIRLEAFNELVRRFQDMAVGYAFSLLGEEDLGDDTAQEAFVQLYIHLNSVRTRRRARGGSKWWFSATASG